jgi:hypothetical protein
MIRIWKMITSLFKQKSTTTPTLIVEEKRKEFENAITEHLERTLVSDSNGLDKITPAIVAETYDNMMSEAKKTSKQTAKKKYYKKTPKKTAPKKASK